LKEQPEMTSDNAVLWKEIDQLAGQFFRDGDRKRVQFVDWLRDTLDRARNTEFLLIHNPGGWGNTVFEECLEWERSIVTGITNTMDEIRRNWVLVQYFRSGNSFWSHMRDIKKEALFFFKGESPQAKALAAALRFISNHLLNLKIILIGASQGAAFSNAVMREPGDFSRVYSIELGIFFPHMGRRLITERTLAVDSNGLMSDPMCNRDLWKGFKSYITAPYRWVKSRIEGTPQKFTYCINAPGHDYNWEYPEVQRRIIDFLETNFGNNQQ
jgi:hypothetical protein